MLNRAFLIVGLFLVGFWTAVDAQTPLQNRIRAGALVLAGNMKKGQFDKIVDSIYPPALEIAGGRAALISGAKEGISQMEKAGVNFGDIDIGVATGPVVAGDKMFATVPQNLHMTGPNMKLEQLSYLLAVSTDKGNTWYYLDGAGLNDALVKKIFPDFPAALKLPERQQPKITPTS